MMKKSFTIILLFVGTLLQAQDFYDMNTIQTIEITFAESNWDQLLDNAYASTGDYILAQSVAINGTEFDSVGVKYKGNSTYQANQTKNPFHIELDTYKDHEYDGYTDVKLSNVAKDPSFLREVLSYQILRQYMDAPLSNYANVYVNGELIGLYSNSEAVSRKFVNSRFYSKNNTFVKCNPPDGAGMGTTDFPNLVYQGTNVSSYEDAYELKSDEGWDELIDLCDTLANHTDDIELILDVDRALWMLAFDNVLVNLDSYIGAFAQNYYLYRQDNGRFASVVWDLNESFGQFSNTGSGSLNSTTAKQQMDHLIHDNDPNFPLIQKLFAVPMFKRMYLAHFKTILLENFDNNAYAITGEALQQLIDDAVQADPNKFFTYDNFTSNLEDDVNAGGGPPGGGNTPGITNLMDGRTDYLLGLSDFTTTEPTISDVTSSEANPIIGTNITVTANITDGTTAFLGHRSDVEDRFFRIEMYDDGAHNDGAANDGTFGVDLEITGPFTQYYIYAENANIGKFSPERAEHEYHIITATVSNPTVGDLVINEFMASNGAAAPDPSGEYDDWIELYNNSNTIIDLSGYTLSDDGDDLLKWTFPAGSSIDANGYLIVWADDDEGQDGLHANFKLSAAAESIFLLDATGTIIDEVTYVNQTEDISYGRFPNGIGNFQLMSPTHNGENIGVVSTSNIAAEAFTMRAFPNPSTGSFYLELNEDSQKERTLIIYDLNGKVCHQEQISKDSWIDTSTWESGMYIVRVEGSFLKMVVL